MRDHGGNLDQAMARFGGDSADWIDLSTGINRVAYPLPELSAPAWRDLPTRSALRALIDVAAQAYRTEAAILPVSGAQAAIQMIPRLSAPARARVLAPTYNEHAASLRGAGWEVEEVATLQSLKGADFAVIVNPNNPDGQRHSPSALLDLLPSVGRLVVDESFADATPDLSVAPQAGVRRGLFVLRSFGKFYGLAGLRLGFVLGHPADIGQLADMAGPWPVSGPAIEIGRRALGDRKWQAETTRRLESDCRQLDAIVRQAGFDLAGGTALFRLYRTENAQKARDQLARTHIWSRIFPWSDSLIRLGLPGRPEEWRRLEQAVQPA